MIAPLPMRACLRQLFMHYLAAEPLLEDLMPDLSKYISGIDWAALGGETGNGHRPMELQWARNVRDLCNERGIAFWFLGHGGTHQKDTFLDGVQHTAFPVLLEAYREKMKSSSDAAGRQARPAEWGGEHD